VSLGDFKDGKRLKGNINSFKEGVQSLSEFCGTVDSPKAEEIECSICCNCLKYRPG